MSRITGVCIAVAAFGLAPFAAAQSSVVGRVATETGAPIAGLPVVVDNGVNQSVAITDQDGAFSAQVPSGEGYRVIFNGERSNGGMMPARESMPPSWMPYLGHEDVDMLLKEVGGIGLQIGEGVYAKSSLFGYWLGEPYWGRGIMTAAVQATSEYALDQFDLVRLEAPVFEWNPSSMRVLEKCGFVREAVLKKSIYKDGLIIDAVLYVMLR